MTDEKKAESLPEPSPVEHGGRVELRLDQAAGDAPVRYNARWFTADERIEGNVEIADGKPPEVTVAPEGELPDWLSSFTVTLVRTTARSAAQENNWPRRLTRWRAAPKK